jgi:O-antigen/teichoic acid export membrane protein
MSKKQFKYGVVLSYAVIVFNIVAGLLYTPWMISKIGKADYGLYVLVTSFLAYFTVDYGLYQAVSKMVAERCVKKDTDGERDVLNVALTIYVVLDLCIMIALAVAYFYIGDIYSNLTSQELSLFRKLYIIAACFVMFSFPLVFLKGIFMAKEYFVQIKSLEMLQKLCLILLTITLLYFNFGVIALVIAYGIVPLATRLVQWYILHRKGVRFKLWVFKKFIAKELFSTSFWLFVYVFAQLMMTNISPSLLAKFTNTTQIAIFAIGLSLYNYVYAFSGAINGFFLPTIFRLINREDNASMLRIGAMTTSVQMYIVGLFVIGLFLVGKDFITLWVGTSFLPAWYICLLLLTPCLVSFSQAVEHQELFAVNKMWCSALIKACSAICSLCLGVWLIPKFQAVGCAISLGVSMTIFEVIAINFVYVKVLHRSRIPFIKVLLRFIVSSTISIGIYKLTAPYIWDNTSWINLVLQSGYFFIIYTVFAYFISIPKDVKNYVLGPIMERIKKNNNL